jgi:hypothetical protein
MICCGRTAGTSWTTLAGACHANPLLWYAITRRGSRSGCSAQVKEEPEGRGIRSRAPAVASSERKQKLLGSLKNLTSKHSHNAY